MRIISIFIKMTYLSVFFGIIAVGVVIATSNLSSNTTAQGGGASLGNSSQSEDVLSKLINFYSELYGVEEPNKQSLELPKEVEGSQEESSGPAIRSIATP